MTIKECKDFLNFIEEKNINIGCILKEKGKNNYYRVYSCITKSITLVLVRGEKAAYTVNVYARNYKDYVVTDRPKRIDILSKQAMKKLILYLRKLSSLKVGDILYTEFPLEYKRMECYRLILSIKDDYLYCINIPTYDVKTTLEDEIFIQSQKYDVETFPLFSITDERVIKHIDKIGDVDIDLYATKMRLLGKIR